MTLPLPNSYKIPENWKKIVLRKPKSPLTVEVVKDFSMSPDGWFVRWNYLKKGKIVETHLMIEKDIEQYIDYNYRQGWKEDETQREKNESN